MERLEFKFAADQADAKTGEFSGYGAVFGNVDSHGDVIEPGAFKETLAAWEAKGSLPTMKLMHGTAVNPFAGSDLPVGRWSEMREDSKGLFVRGKLSGIDTEIGRYYFSLMNDGALNALSIGYKATKAQRGSGPAIKRHLHAVNLFEVSILPEGSNPQALVTDVKSIAAFTKRDFERDLASGTLPALSKKEAKALLAGGFDALTIARDAEEAGDELERFWAAMRSAPIIDLTGTD